MMSKLLFMHHIINLEITSLAKQVQMAQQKHDLPGLTKEVEDMIIKVKLPNCFDVKLSKSKWKIWSRGPLIRLMKRKSEHPSSHIKKLTVQL